MCFMSSPKMPEAPRAVLPKKPPRRIDEDVLDARRKQRTNEAARRGLRSAFRTGPGGLADVANVTGKTLLGQ